MMFVKHEHIHDHDTRKKNNLRPIKTQLSLVQKSVIGQLIKIYNHLPSDIKSLKTVKLLKLKLKELLIKKAYYSLDEYYSDIF